MAHKYRTGTDANGRRFWFVWCPGCNDTHQISDAWQVTEHDDGTLTVEPSILVTQPPTEYRCHSYLRGGGTWQYLADCSHDHAGGTAAMVDLPPYMQDDE